MSEHTAGEKPSRRTFIAGGAAALGLGAGASQAWPGRASAAQQRLIDKALSASASTHLGDITLAEPGAVIGFAGARVIEETIREKLPVSFQRAEYLHEHGMVDQVVPRGELHATLARLLSLLREPHRLPPALPAPAAAMPRPDGPA